MYEGGCHCGAVRYQVEMNFEKLITCNCSICQKTGAILGFVPETQFTLLQGEESLGDYQFHKKLIHHLFCTKCGVRSFSRGSDGQGNEMIAINVRCLDGVHAEDLVTTLYDGRNR